MGVSTGKGDDGTTSLYRGGRVPKDHLITETNGAVDEAISHIGLGRSAAKEGRTKRILLQVQQDLFTVGAEISTEKSHWKSLKKVITPTHVEWLEKLVEDFEEALALPSGFVAFGQKENASHLDVARTAVRRAERLAVKMKSEGLIENPELLRYLNRLSDYLFVLARYCNRAEGRPPPTGPDRLAGAVLQEVVCHRRHSAAHPGRRHRPTAAVSRPARAGKPAAPHGIHGNHAPIEGRRAETSICSLTLSWID